MKSWHMTLCAPNYLYQIPGEKVSLEKLLQDADFVSVHTASPRNQALNRPGTIS